MNKPLVQWQLIDPSNHCVFPWFTHPFLEVLRTWDLKGKVILEYGGGRSTVWWRYKSFDVITIESNEAFSVSIEQECQERELYNGSVTLREINEGDQARKYEYVKAYPLLLGGPARYDIVVVDGILRYECIQEGIFLLTRLGGKLIVDNWQQDGFICPACADLLQPYEGHVYRQEDHTDHHGNPWQTAYWEIPAI